VELKTIAWVMASSLVVHGALAAGLMVAANRRVESRRRSIAVQVAEEKKKKAAPKPPPPKPIARPPAPRKVAVVPKEAPAPAPVAHAPKAAPVAVPIQMSNAAAVAEDNTPGGIVIPVNRPAAAAAKPSAVKTASVGQEGRKRLKAELGAGPSIEGGEAPCTEAPTKPVPVFKVKPEYTTQARAEGIEGMLVLRLTVGRDGSVTQVDVLKSVSPELDAASVETAKKWRFTPAMACGKPVDGGTYVFQTTFELGD